MGWFTRKSEKTYNILIPNNSGVVVVNLSGEAPEISALPTKRGRKKKALPSEDRSYLEHAEFYSDPRGYLDR